MERAMVFIWQKKRSRGDWQGRGAALLLLLIAIAILALLYTVQIDTFFGTGRRGGRSAPEHRPWLEESRIVPGDKLIPLPEPPKPTLDEPHTLTAAVSLDGSDRGTATLDFAISGEVSGTWYSEYSSQARDYIMEADFAGNIDIDKTWTQGETTDESRLYFFTMGTYKQTAYNAEAGTEIPDEGIVYVTGWLSADYSASGLITITTDRTWSATYALETGP
jgi:hypothetical protein